MQLEAGKKELVLIKKTQDGFNKKIVEEKRIQKKS